MKRHTLKAVIKLSEDLFLPHAHKGTYIVIIESWKQHIEGSSVFFALMDDGFAMKKAKRLPNHFFQVHFPNPLNCSVIDPYTKETLHVAYKSYLDTTGGGFSCALAGFSD